MTPRLLQQVIHIINHCAYRVMNQPNDPDCLVYSFHALHHVVNKLRDEAVIVDAISEMGTTPSVVSEYVPSSFTGQDNGQSSTTMESTKLLLACPSVGYRTLVSVGENKNDTFYFCDRMILFQNPHVNVQDGDEVTMALVTSTALLNYATVCYRYGLLHTDSDSKRTLLLQCCSQIYSVVIEFLLNAISMTLPVTSTDADFYQVGNVEVLLILAYNNLGLTYHMLCMSDEYHECMVKLHSIFKNQSSIFDLIQPASFADIIEEIKLNAIYWKSFVASPVALAA